MTTTKWIVFSIALAVSGGSAAVWHGGDDHSASPLKVRTQPDTALVVRGIGYVEPKTELRRLGFESAGVIGTCPVRVGQRVAKGAELISLRNEKEFAEVGIAEAALRLKQAQAAKVLAGVHDSRIRVAQRDIEILTVKLDHARRERDRSRRLWSEHATAAATLEGFEADVQRLTAEFDRAQHELEHLQRYVTPEDEAVAKAEVQLAEQRLRAARQELQQTTIVAPYDGTVLEILGREGERVDGRPVILFGDTSDLRVRAEIDERFVQDIREGQAVTVSGSNLHGESFAGAIVLVKQLMGEKRVFAQESDERIDLDVAEVLIQMEAGFRAPLGLRVDVAVVTTPLRKTQP